MILMLRKVYLKFKYETRSSYYINTKQGHKIDDIEEEDDNEITTEQSKMVNDILSFFEQCEKYD